MIAAGIALAYAQKALLAIALIVLFAVVRRRWNTALALFAVAVTAFPPVYWRISDDFLTEPPQRIAFLLAFACAIALSGPRRTSDEQRSVVPAFLLLGLWLVATHLKVQWYVGAILLLPVLVFETSRGNLVSTRALALGAAALLVPVERDRGQLDRLAHDHAEPGLRTSREPALRRRRAARVFRDHGNRAVASGLRGPGAAAAPLVEHLRRARGDSRRVRGIRQLRTAIPAAAPGLRAAQLLDRPAARVDGPSRATNHAGPHPARAARPAMGHAGSLARHRDLDPARRRARVPGDASPLCAGARPVDRPGHRQHRLAVRAAISPADVRDRRRRCSLRRRDASAALRQAQGRPFDRLGRRDTVEGRRLAPER